jgi:6-phosphofructokinase 1
MVVDTLLENSRKGKKAGIVVAAEGCGRVSQLAHEIETQTGSEVRLSILGYAQRGGSQPRAADFWQVFLLKKQSTCSVRGKATKRWDCKMESGQHASEEACSKTKQLDANLLKLADMLAT